MENRWGARQRATYLLHLHRGDYFRSKNFLKAPQLLVALAASAAIIAGFGGVVPSAFHNAMSGGSGPRGGTSGSTTRC